MFGSKRRYSSGKVPEVISGEAVFTQQAQILFNWVNMVRARVVAHPSEWGKFSGYNEIQKPRKRYSLVDHNQLAILLGKERVEDLIASHAAWVEEALEQETEMRDEKWSGSIAVGSEEFVEKT